MLNQHASKSSPKLQHEQFSEEKKNYFRTFQGTNVITLRKKHHLCNNKASKTMSVWTEGKSTAKNHATPPAQEFNAWKHWKTAKPSPNASYYQQAYDWLMGQAKKDQTISTNSIQHEFLFVFCLRTSRILTVLTHSLWFSFEMTWQKTALNWQRLDKQ